MDKTLHTKYGTARIYKGYYKIDSRKEGNKNKLLHRLIWEDFWRTKIPKGYHIHHKNGNKLDNCILNLQLIKAGEHSKLHNSNENNPFYDKKHSNETIDKMCTVRNTSGYYRVHKTKCNKCKQGFIWVYRYHDKNGKAVNIKSIDINKLETKVKSKGLKWDKF